MTTPQGDDGHPTPSYGGSSFGGGGTPGGYGGSSAGSYGGSYGGDRPPDTAATQPVAPAPEPPAPEPPAPEPPAPAPEPEAERPAPAPAEPAYDPAPTMPTYVATPLPDPGPPTEPMSPPVPPVATPVPPAPTPAPAPTPPPAEPKKAAKPNPAAAQPLKTGKTRRARLVVRRVDPWSVLKFALLFSLCLLIVFVVAVAALYYALDALGVFDSLNQFFREFTQAGSDGQETGGFEVTFSAGTIIGGAAVIGAINVVIITAISTLGAFLYNLCSDIVGGIEVTLAERD